MYIGVSRLTWNRERLCSVTSQSRHHLSKNSAIKQLVVFTTECLYFAASTTKIRTRNVSRFVEFERHAEHHARQAAAATNADVIRRFKPVTAQERNKRTRQQRHYTIVLFRSSMLLTEACIFEFTEESSLEASAKQHHTGAIKNSTRIAYVTIDIGQEGDSTVRCWWSGMKDAVYSVVFLFRHIFHLSELVLGSGHVDRPGELLTLRLVVDFLDRHLPLLTPAHTRQFIEQIITIVHNDTRLNDCANQATVMRGSR